MKAFVSILLALLLALSLAACSTGGGQAEKEEMALSPTSFSQETQDVLSILDDELSFFDYQVEEPIQSVSFQLWFCQDGTWESAGRVYGDAKAGEHRIAIRVNGSTCDIFTIDETGHTKSSYPNTVDFSGCAMTSKTRLTTSAPIADGKEIPLFLWLGTDQNALAVTLDEDFRELGCTAGVAVTATFSSEAAE